MKHRTIRYDSGYLTCSKKLTGSQPSLPQSLPLIICFFFGLSLIRITKEVINDFREIFERIVGKKDFTGSLRILKLLLLMLQLFSRFDEIVFTSFQLHYGNDSRTTEIVDYIQVQASMYK